MSHKSKVLFPGTLNKVATQKVGCGTLGSSGRAWGLEPGVQRDRVPALQSVHLCTLTPTPTPTQPALTPYCVAFAQVWSTMLAGFERSVLNTHRSKFSQFLLFYMCHKHPEPCTRFFVEFLIKRLQVGCSREQGAGGGCAGGKGSCWRQSREKGAGSNKQGAARSFIGGKGEGRV